MTLYVSRTLIDPNPWQPRQNYDPANIQELADRIEAHENSRPDTFGLLQLPAGRLVDKKGQLYQLEKIPDQDFSSWMDAHDLRLQLAYGHRRNAAFEILGLDLLPVEIGDFSDREMSTLAWTENSARLDLDPVEEALFIQRIMTDFGLTQEAAAEQLGLSRPVVANKLRLLKLPQDIRDHLAAGELSERQALALLSMFELPETILEKARNLTWESTSKPSEIVRDALAGESSEKTRQRIDGIVNRFGIDLKDADFDQKKSYETENIHTPACVDCDARLVIGRRKICTVPKCHAAKTEIAHTEYLLKASEVSGIQARMPEDGKSDGHHGTLAYDSQYVAQIRSAGCEHLRLIWDPTNSVGSFRNATLAEEGYPCATVACNKPKQFCSCLQGLKAAKNNPNLVGAQRDLEGSPDQAPAFEGRPLVETLGKPVGLNEPVEAEPALSPEPTAAELEAMARQARIERKRAEGTVKNLQASTADMIQRFLETNDLGVWYLITAGDYISPFSDPLDLNRDLDSYREELAETLAIKVMPSISGAPDLDAVFGRLNATLANACLPQFALDGDQILEQDPVGDLVRRFERISGWIERLDSAQLSMLESLPDAIQGNLNNLNRLDQEVVRLLEKAKSNYSWHPDPRLEDLRLRIIDAHTKLLEVQEKVKNG